MNAIFLTILPLVITGLTFLAYKHHYVYVKLHPYLLGILTCIVFSFMYYDNGVQDFCEKIEKSIPNPSPEILKNIFSVRNDLSISTGNLLLWFIGSFLFLNFLFFMNHIINEDKKNNTKKID